VLGSVEAYFSSLTFYLYGPKNTREVQQRRFGSGILLRRSLSTTKHGDDEESRRGEQARRAMARDDNERE
jgi:hypothetical protein